MPYIDVEGDTLVMFCFPVEPNWIWVWASCSILLVPGLDM